MFGKKGTDATELQQQSAAAPSPLLNPTGLPPATQMQSLTSKVASTGTQSAERAAPLVRYRDMNLETAAYSAAKQWLIGELLDQGAAGMPHFAKKAVAASLRRKRFDERALFDCILRLHRPDQDLSAIAKYLGPARMISPHVPGHQRFDGLHDRLL